MYLDASTFMKGELVSLANRQRTLADCAGGGIARRLGLPATLASLCCGLALLAVSSLSNIGRPVHALHDAPVAPVRRHQHPPGYRTRGAVFAKPVSRYYIQNRCMVKHRIPAGSLRPRGACCSVLTNELVESSASFHVPREKISFLNGDYSGQNPPL